MADSDNFRDVEAGNTREDSSLAELSGQRKALAMTQGDDIYRAFQTFWNLMDTDTFDYVEIQRPGDRIGDLFRVWLTLEEHWIRPVDVGDVLEAVPLDSFETVSHLARRLVAWSDMLALVGDNMDIGRISEVLEAFVIRQGVFAVDPRPRITGPIPHNQFEYGAAGEATDYEELEEAAVIGRLARALHIMTRRLGEESAAEDALGLDTGTFDRIKPLLLGSRAARDEAAERAEIVSRARAKRVRLLDLLRRAVALHPDNADVIHALGTCLALSGELDEAVERFRRAATLKPSNVPVRYMMSDVAAALGSRPTASMGSLIDLESFDPSSESYDPSPANEADHLYLVLRGMLVELGAVDPYSWSGERPQVSAPERRVAVDRNEPISPEAYVEERRKAEEDARIRDERILTELGAVRVDLRYTYAREAVLLDKIAGLMPRQRREKITNRLSRTVKCWSKVSETARQKLIASRYLRDDPELSTSEGVTAIIVSACLAVEIAGREMFGLGPRAGLDMVAARASRYGGSAASGAVLRLNELRDDAAHQRKSLTKDDIKEVWEIVRGPHESTGLLDMIFEEASVQRGERR